jgi:hypothetical protein
MGGLIYPQLCHNGFPMDGNNGGFWVWINPKFTTLNRDDLHPKDQLNFGEIHFLFEYFLNAIYGRKEDCMFFFFRGDYAKSQWSL